MMDTLLPRDDLADEMKNFRFYYYEPSMTAAILFTVVFALATIFHSYQLARTRTWFMLPFVIGGIFETIGYIGRILSANENPGPYDKIPYIIQSLLLLLAPLFFAASIYMELGRIVIMVKGEKKLFIRRTWLTKIFVFGDVACFMIQATGSGFLASKDASKVEFGNWAVIAGLGLQVAFFGFFVIAASLFHLRLKRSPTPLSFDRPWTKHMLELYIVSGLILIRSIMRLIEYIQGYDGFVMTHEAFLYCFDAVPMFAAVVTMAIIHPGEVAGFIRGMWVADSKGEYEGLNEESV